jgi:hypothetical protein
VAVRIAGDNQLQLALRQRALAVFEGVHPIGVGARDVVVGGLVGGFGLVIESRGFACGSTRVTRGFECADNGFGGLHVPFAAFVSGTHGT